MRDTGGPGGAGQSCIRDRHGMSRWGWPSWHVCLSQNPIGCPVGGGWAPSLDPAILQVLTDVLRTDHHVRPDMSSGPALLCGMAMCRHVAGSGVQARGAAGCRTPVSSGLAVCGFAGQRFASMPSSRDSRSWTFLLCFAVLEIVFRAACFGQKVIGKSVPYMAQSSQ